ncbi:MAG: hypothetical protein JWM75_1243 [Sphingomonas bacterium]|jgi:Ni/Co efflux regulator RcnB|nr:hypothetical protein [Sphingomonas bacterium]
MKKFLIAAVAASVLATPVLAAPYQGRDDHRGGRAEQNDRGAQSRDQGQYRNRGQVQKRVVIHKKEVRRQQAQYRSWHKGDRFDSRYARNYRVISSPRAYRLHDAPRGYRWVQSGNDAVLIGITSGVIASILANVIR